MQLEELKSEKGVSVGKMNPKAKGSDTTKKIDVLDDPISVQRRERVKNAMIHAWSSYEKFAWGHDELQVWCIFE